MTNYTKECFLEGQMLLIDKPLSWTSFQAVNKIKWELRKKFDLKKIKIGHAGTLDPLASGLLIICTGKNTKKIEAFQSQEKQYQGEITLGATTPSYDLETEVNKKFSVEHITDEKIKACAKQFLGDINQYPPIFSALKKDGKRLYEYARNHQKVSVEPRQIHISSFDVTSINFPKVYFLVNCSKGTYIRSLAYDFGKALDSGAYLSALRRTKIGAYSVENAISPQQFINQL